MTNTCELVSKQILSSDASSITFTNIPQNYTDLYFVYSARTARTNNNWDGVRVSINGTGNTGLSTRSMFGYSSTVGSNTDVNGSFGMAATDAGTASTFGNSYVYIPNYTASTNKSMSVEGVSETNATSSLVWAAATLWSNTAAIATLQLFTESGSNFKAGSAFYLYGVRSANFAPGVFMSASGGDQVTISGGYKYHVFRSSGIFQVNQPGWAEYLVVAGGGGSGGAIGGGGGAGEFRPGSVLLAAGPVPVVVGGGGTGGAASDSAQGGDGSGSSFGNLTVARGGGGGGSTYAAGRAGGSGGGQSIGTGGGGASTASTGGFGFAGGSGNGTVSAPAAGGGGGGAGSVGAAALDYVGGNGGAGRQWSDGNFYAGGGGGATQGTNVGTYTPGTGGVGGGGSASRNTAGTPGTVNTGGGAGGSPGSPTFAGVSGGSGIVIIRYPA